MIHGPRAKQRLDLLLLERNLTDTLEEAQASILAGKVFVNAQKADKPGQAVRRDARIEVEAKLKFVSRGGLKLEAALSAFSIAVAGKICLDVGTSTGGFTDCLLQAQAARVHAVDTGAGQIAWKLRSDSRVVLHEKTNARYLTFEQIGELVDLVVLDVSFISATVLLPVLQPFVTNTGDWIVLVKPQFEAPKERVGRGGIVRDPEVQQTAIKKVCHALQGLGLTTSLIDSPILGAEGNKEFFLHARRPLSS